MTRSGNRKSRGKKQDTLPKQLPGNKFDEISLKETPESSENRKVADSVDRNGNPGVPSAPSDSKSLVRQMSMPSKKKTQKQKSSGIHVVISQEAVDSDHDARDEVSLNFKARSAKKAALGNTDDIVSGSTTSMEKQFIHDKIKTPVLKKTRTVKENQKADIRSNKTHDDTSRIMDISGDPTPVQKSDDVALETGWAEEKTIEGKQPNACTSEEQAGVRRKSSSRKRKSSQQKNDIPLKKSVKSDHIFFYCGNLPPGVTNETLRFFLEEEGIHPKVTLKRMKGQNAASTATLTAKQRLYKKNQLKAAKAVFATVIVKTEEDAKKMLSLNGISMPSPSNKDWDTQLKIIRRLPRPDKFPYKVHIGNLHPAITEEELTQYLESQGVKPGHVLIIRTQRTQKSRRYGFVWFRSVPDADKAVDLPAPIIRDRQLVIQHSFKKRFKNF
ncbi:uncharacterized protein LOC110985120 [Acanthaster planci]|uniref:Uncharacterized protein LOC110985120 n=1 Tax=Acanthaster planci TaxID=133434 RepID=A0A8B7Z7G2_ACAPL|nr:uncharacterized protein LOC110985120 [Acanthaster planci]